MANNSDYSMLDFPKERRRVRFDPTINLGHILTFCGFIIAGMGAWSTLDRRVTIVEQAVPAITVQSDIRDKQTQQALANLRNDIHDVQSSVNSLNAILLSNKK